MHPATFNLPQSHDWPTPPSRADNDEGNERLQQRQQQQQRLQQTSSSNSSSSEQQEQQRAAAAARSEQQRAATAAVNSSYPLHTSYMHVDLAYITLHISTVA